ncbi:MAG: hypothetical protein K0S86_2785 [Geminicoccaceae bacterium]|nr:hypothetical protein [Geminicoccaceae bacterium]
MACELVDAWHRTWRYSSAGVALAIVLSCRPATVIPSVAEGGTRWWKGNTHTHTLWSDGDDFPEMVADWYKQRGYHFLSITDHNTLASEERWWRVPATGIGREAYDKYRARFGNAVEERRADDTLSVRLRRLAEYGPSLVEPGRFLLVPGEEITQYLDRRGAHMNALNVAEVIPPQQGASLVEILRRDLELVRDQEQRTGGEINAVLNHPNFIWSQTAEDLLALPALRFFEVYNGHPLVNVQGDSRHASNERIWDIVLTHRFSSDGGSLFAVATDDSHDYHRTGSDQRNSGRGWIVVRASELHADSLMEAMRRGDFYASNGVELTDVRRDGTRLALTIAGAPGVTYTTQFIGTRRGWDTTSVALHDSAGRAVTRRYSADVGAVLAEVRGTTPSYTMRGDELYVRARVVSSRAKPNASYAGEVEMGWTQPVRP